MDRELEGLKACRDKIVFNLDSNLIQRELRRRAAASGAQPASPQVELTEDDIAKAREAVKIVFRELGIGFIERREQIVKDQTTRLKAVLEESSQ